jgi:hypothetical protein
VSGASRFAGQRVWIASIVQTLIDGFVLPAAINTHESPRQMIVHRRRRASRHDEREEAERTVLGAIECVLRDATAHPALFVGPGARLGQPSVSRKQLRERRT